MMNIVDQVKDYVLKEIEKYKEESDDNYDYWEEHIKYVYEESIRLAELYGADIEIVSLGALLHDIALIAKIGKKNDHHINGETISKVVLTDLKYDPDKMNRVLKCVLHHRSSKNAETIEETCVADADVLAHFDNISMAYNYAFITKGMNLSETKTWIKDAFEKDYDDLSERTKESFKERYKLIKDVVLNIKEE